MSEFGPSGHRMTQYSRTESEPAKRISEVHLIFMFAILDFHS